MKLIKRKRKGIQVILMWKINMPLKQIVEFFDIWNLDKIQNNEY